nr:MAG TPA: hypothetical protein [Caudoviricetes sp.]
MVISKKSRTFAILKERKGAFNRKLTLLSRYFSIFPVYSVRFVNRTEKQHDNKQQVKRIFLRFRV